MMLVRKVGSQIRLCRKLENNTFDDLWMICNTSVCSNPWTSSLLTCVIKSPTRIPDAYAADFS